MAVSALEIRRWVDFRKVSSEGQGPGVGADRKGGLRTGNSKQRNLVLAYERNSGEGWPHSAARLASHSDQSSHTSLPRVLFSDLLSGWNHQFTKALKSYQMQVREDGSVHRTLAVQA